MRLKRLICFKYYIVLKWEGIFTLGLNPTKIRIVSLYQKMLHIKVVQNKISYKTGGRRTYLSSTRVELGA